MAELMRAVVAMGDLALDGERWRLGCSPARDALGPDPHTGRVIAAPRSVGRGTEAASQQAAGLASGTW